MANRISFSPFTLHTIKRIIILFLLPLFGLIPQTLWAQCGNPSEFEILPDLYPPRTIRMAIHVIHRDSINDTTNIPVDVSDFHGVRPDYWAHREQTVNALLGASDAPKYYFYDKGFRRDSKIRVRFDTILHHVDPVLFLSRTGNDLSWEMSGLKSKFVTNNSQLTAFQKDKWMHLFYVRDSTAFFTGKFVFGGAALTKEIRFTERLNDYYVWQSDTLFDNLRADDNFIHELLHTVRIKHNFIYSDEPPFTEVNGACDYTIAGHRFGEDTTSFPFRPNNYMYKGGGKNATHGPVEGSITLCQAQRSLYYLWNFDNEPPNSAYNVYDCVTGIDDCYNYHTTVLKNDFSTLNYSTKAYGDIIVPEGVTFTVNCQLEMPSNTKIIVKPGGKLVVDGGTITSSTTCNDFWQGIELWGNTAKSQLEKNYGTDHLQGVAVFKNGAVIENARVAVWTQNPISLIKTGGIVHASNTTFRNNIQSVIMAPYHNFNPANGKDWRDISYFHQCRFEYTNQWLDTTVQPQPALSMNNVKGVTITQCTFINTHPTFFPGTSFRGTGIYAQDADWYSSQCRFEGLWRGVQLGDVVRAPRVTLERDTFMNCYLGTVLRYNDFATVQQNVYDNCRFGQYILFSGGFNVTENTFKNHAQWGIGAYTINTGTHANKIYNNSFDNLGTGIQATAGGTGSNAGLSFGCNLFTPNNVNRYDLVVTSGVVDKQQGRCNDGKKNEAITPAGNRLSHSCGTPAADFDIWNGYPQKIKYSHHRQQNSTDPYKPSCYSSSVISTNGCLADFNTLLSCPTQAFVQGPLGTMQHYSDSVRIQLGQELDQRRILGIHWSDSLDGGNTSQLIATVNDPLQSSAQIRSALNLKYVSDAVLIAALERQPVLNDTDLVAILTQHSPLSVPLADQLETLTHLLSSTQIAALQALQGGLSVRDEKELLLRYHTQQADLALNRLVRHLAYDTLIESPEDSMIAVLQGWNTPLTLQTLVRLYWSTEQYTLAQQSLDTLLLDTAYTEYGIVAQKIHQVLADNDSTTTVWNLVSDTLLLDSLALDTFSSAQALAQNLMHQLTGKEYAYREETLPGSGPATRIRTGTTEQSLPSNGSTYQIYPNPNPGTFTLLFPEPGTVSRHNQPNQLKRPNPIRRVTVYNTMGHVVFQTTFEHTPLQQLITLKEASNGVYHLVVEENKIPVYSSKLIVRD